MQGIRGEKDKGREAEAEVANTMFFSFSYRVTITFQVLLKTSSSRRILLVVCLSLSGSFLSYLFVIPIQYFASGYKDKRSLADYT